MYNQLLSIDLPDNKYKEKSVVCNSTASIHTKWSVCARVLGMWSLFVVSQGSATEIEIHGLDDQIKANVQSYLETKTYDCESALSLVSQQRKDLNAQIKAAIQPYGYFNPSMEVSKSSAPECEKLVVDIQLGPITRLDEVHIEVTGEGAADADFIKLLDNHSIQTGAPLKQSAYRQLKNQLAELASEKFYLDARFSSQKLDVYPDKNLANITLVFASGPRYQISAVHIDTAQPFLRQNFLKRLVNLKAGQYVTQGQLYKLKQKLNSLGYFAQALFKIDEQQKEDGRVPISIQLTPAAKYDYAVGLGYSTDAGVKASFKYNNHRINNRGHQFNSELDLSELSNELTAAYKIPSLVNPANKWYSIQLGYRDEQTDNVDSQTSKLGFSETRIKNNRWQNINFIDVIHERFDTGMTQGESLLLVPGLSWSLTDADNLARPTRGFKIQAEFKGASEDLFSDASFAQLTISGKFIQAVGASNRLLYRAQIGATASSDFDELPTAYRFFAGGDQSIRGYDYESLSPLNVAGDLAGGKHLAVGSVEFEHQFAPQWAVAAFTDFGDAYSDEFDLKYSVGAGLRWFSPIGPIRLDIGVPLNQESTDFRLHVTIGPDL